MAEVCDSDRACLLSDLRIGCQQQQHNVRGWPLGLQPVNVRMRLLEHLAGWVDHASGGGNHSPSFSSSFSSDLDTESTMSFFPDRSMTLGSLIGIRADARRRNDAAGHGRNDHQGRIRGFLWTLLGCNRNMIHRRSPRQQQEQGQEEFQADSDSAAAAVVPHAPSLGQILALERSCREEGDHVYINVMYEEANGTGNSPYHHPQATATTTLSTICGCLVAVKCE